MPGRLFLPTLLVGAVAPLVWPWLHPMAAAGPMEGWIGGLADTAAGAAVGGLVGWLASRALAFEHRAGLWLGVVSAGIVLGWQAGLLLGAFALLASLLSRRPQGGSGRVLGLSPVGWLAAAALAWIVGWSWLATCLPLMG